MSTVKKTRRCDRQTRRLPFEGNNLKVLRYSPRFVSVFGNELRNGAVPSVRRLPDLKYDDIDDFSYLFYGYLVFLGKERTHTCAIPNHNGERAFRKRHVCYDTIPSQNSRYEHLSSSGTRFYSLRRLLLLSSFG